MTPREPDRFDKQAAQLWRDIAWRERVPSIEQISAAIRAEHASALGRAAQVADRYTGGSAILIADSIRALIPPAAAPAAETGKAQGAEARCPFNEQDCLDARVLLNQCATWMRGRLRHMGTGTVERISCETILAKLAARVAPPEREGK